MSERTTSLRDTLRVIRGQWALIAMTTLVCLGVAYAVSDQQERTYRATASVQFREAAEDVSVVRESIGSRLTEVERAQRGEDLVNLPEVRVGLIGVARGRLMPAELSDALATDSDPQTGVVDLTATTTDASLATDLVNAWARRAHDLARRQVRGFYQSRSSTLRSRLTRAGDNSESLRRMLLRQISELESAALLAAPIEIVTVAPVPDNPVSPRVGLSSTLGGVFGLLLGLALTGARHGMDRRFRASNEIETQMSLPTLTHVPWRRGRGDQDETLRSDELEAMRVLRRKLQARGSPIPVLVTSAVVGEGKSTVAVDLARVLVEGGARTLLVECDLRRPVLAGRLGLAEAPGLSDLLTGHQTANGTVQDVRDPRTREAEAGRLRCVTAGSPTSWSAELLASERMREFLAAASADHDAVILDSCPLLPVADTLGLLPRVEFALLCLNASSTSREEALLARDALRRRPGLEAGLVVTGRGLGDAA